MSSIIKEKYKKDFKEKLSRRLIKTFSGTYLIILSVDDVKFLNSIFYRMHATAVNCKNIENWKASIVCNFVFEQAEKDIVLKRLVLGKNNILIYEKIYYQQKNINDIFDVSIICDLNIDRKKEADSLSIFKEYINNIFEEEFKSYYENDENKKIDKDYLNKTVVSIYKINNEHAIEMIK